MAEFYDSSYNPTTLQRRAFELIGTAIPTTIT